MGSVLERHAAPRNLPAVRFYAKLADQPSLIGPATERVLAGFRREGQARGRGQVVVVRWEQAHAAAAVAGSSGESKCVVQTSAPTSS